jgi:hypothetical protein
MIQRNARSSYISIAIAPSSWLSISLRLTQCSIVALSSLGPKLHFHLLPNKADQPPHSSRTHFFIRHLHCIPSDPRYTPPNVYMPKDMHNGSYMPQRLSTTRNTRLLTCRDWRSASGESWVIKMSARGGMRDQLEILVDWYSDVRLRRESTMVP